MEEKPGPLGVSFQIIFVLLEVSNTVSAMQGHSQGRAEFADGWPLGLLWPAATCGGVWATELDLAANIAKLGNSYFKKSRDHVYQGASWSFFFFHLVTTGCSQVGITLPYPLSVRA